MARIEAHDISVAYRGADRTVSALEGCSLAVASGEPVAIIGPSGCGKSTLLLVLAGLVMPTGGAVSIDGAPLGGPRLRTALILQDFGLLPWKTVRANAALGLQVRGVSAHERIQRASAALVRVGLTEFDDAYPAELSGGMRQRLALARAVALDADVLLMDEPLSALDALTREDLQGLLLEMWQQRGHTAVLVTHSIEEAVFLGRRIVVLSPRPGHVREVIDNPGMSEPGYRATPAFYECCATVRGVLADTQTPAVERV